MNDEKQPRGRPRGWRAKDPRDQMLRVKVTREEKAALQEAAKEVGETVSEYLRLAAAARIAGRIL